MEEQKVNVEETVATPPTEERPPPSVEDMAAHDYQTLIPMFYKKIEECSNRQLKRVVTALVEYPLQGTDFKFSYPQEKELFSMGMRIFDCKFVIMKAVMDMKKEDILKMIEDQKKEVSNG